MDKLKAEFDIYLVIFVINRLKKRINFERQFCANKIRVTIEIS